LAEDKLECTEELGDLVKVSYTYHCWWWSVLLIAKKWTIYSFILSTFI
jgi:hypothetical protein